MGATRSHRGSRVAPRVVPQQTRGPGPLGPTLNPSSSSPTRTGTTSSPRPWCGRKRRKVGPHPRLTSRCNTGKGSVKLPWHSDTSAERGVVRVSFPVSLLGWKGQPEGGGPSLGTESSGVLLQGQGLPPLPHLSLGSGPKHPRTSRGEPRV